MESERQSVTGPRPEQRPPVPGRSRAAAGECEQQREKNEPYPSHWNTSLIYLTQGNRHMYPSCIKVG